MFFKKEKDEKFKTDECFYIVMEIRNTCARMLDLECICPEKILSTLDDNDEVRDRGDSDFSLNEVMN